MNKISLLCLLPLASCGPQELPYPWFEQEWVSDRDSTLEANDGFTELESEELESILADYGNLRWKVEGFALKAIYPDEPNYNLQSEFTIEPIDESSFQLLTEVGTNFRVSGDETGFCVTPEIPWESIECFVPLTTD